MYRMPVGSGRAFPNGYGLRKAYARTVLWHETMSKTDYQKSVHYSQEYMVSLQYDAYLYHQFRRYFCFCEEKGFRTIVLKPS